MDQVRNELLDWLEEQVHQPNTTSDIISKDPTLTVDDAYRLQFAVMDRLAKSGARIMGYKAAHTSLAIQQEQGRGLSVGTLLDTFERNEREPITLIPDLPTFSEPEIGVLLKQDLHGPGICLHDAYRAVEAVFPAIEIVTPARGARKRSEQMSIARGKSEGGFVLGNVFTSLSGIDLRLEGAVVSLNGVPIRSGTGVEAMGHPLNVVAAVANLLGKYGRSLNAGMVLLTGSLTNNIPVAAGDEISVEMTRLGRVAARFAR